MISKQQLIQRALQKNGVAEPAHASDVALVDAVLTPVMDSLATRDIYQWGDPDEYDPDASEHLAGLLANATAEDFGKAFDPQKEIYLESRLRQLQPVTLSGQPQKTEYF
jgi:hypothetical protein